jgi:hypothetical protein
VFADALAVIGVAVRAFVLRFGPGGRRDGAVEAGVAVGATLALQRGHEVGKAEQGIRDLGLLPDLEDRLAGDADLALVAPGGNGTGLGTRGALGAFRA